MPKKQWNNQEVSEEEQGEEEVLDFNKPDFTFVPKGNHNWIQYGPYAICKTCDLQHAIYIGVDNHLVGIDKKGNPILKKVKDW